MKETEIEHNWLAEIDGLTVAEAIAYLQTLPQDQKLRYWMDGDTHGCSIECRLVSVRPYTDEEKAQMAAKRKAERIDKLHRDIAYYQKKLADNHLRPTAQQLSWGMHYQQSLDKLQKKLQELEVA